MDPQIRYTDRQPELTYSPSKINHNIKNDDTKQSFSTGGCEVTNISGLLVKQPPEFWSNTVGSLLVNYNNLNLFKQE